jgi:surfactin synthase thioesterase subunit
MVWLLVEPVLRNDLRLLQDRRAADQTGEPPLPLPISVFCGTYDTIAGPAQVANWSAHTERFLGVHAFPGDHFYFRRTRSEVVGQIVGDLRALVPC